MHNMLITVEALLIKDHNHAKIGTQATNHFHQYQPKIFLFTETYNQDKTDYVVSISYCSLDLFLNSVAQATEHK